MIFETVNCSNSSLPIQVQSGSETENIYFVVASLFVKMQFKNMRRRGKSNGISFCKMYKLWW